MEYEPDLREAVDAAESLHRSLRNAKTASRQANQAVRELAQVRDNSRMTVAEKVAEVERITRELQRTTAIAHQRSSAILKQFYPANAQPKEAQHVRTRQVA